MKLLVLALFGVCALTATALPAVSDKCSSILSNELKEEIAAYKDVTNRIIQYVIEGNFKGKTYDELSKFVDTFGARPSGSEELERSIDYMIQLSQAEGLDVITEPVEVPHWVRGEESVTMLQPRIKNMAVLGLGKSVSTPAEGITAEVIVFKDFDELENAHEEDVRGKIVLYDPQFTTYGETVKYRSGASKAAVKGAVASLVRSVAPFSINSPHTGSQYYEDDVNRIPTAAITIEDADLIRRLYNIGETVMLNIKMQSSFENTTSRNTLVNLEGSTDPTNVVIVSGHIDSWDVGQGAMDDGGGLFISWAAPVIMKQLGLTPKRTVQAIFWTAEELGLIGAYAYEEKHRSELENINFIMESDEGTFTPLGLEFTGNELASCIVAEVLKLLEPINTTQLEVKDTVGSDIEILVSKGIPGAGLLNENDKYFWFHHTEGDTMSVMNSDDLDLSAALWTAVSYVIADLSTNIPR